MLHHGMGSIGRKIASSIPATNKGSLNRIIGTTDIDGNGTHHPLEQVDPFLLLDHGSISKHGMPPFGTHPHRGHSVITILLHGKMQSWDSLTDETTTIEGPSSYWVDAASGVYHNESSIITDANDISQHVSAFQLWISIKEVERQCSPSLQYDGNLPLGEIRSSTDGGEEVVGTIRYFVGGDNTVIKTIRPVLVGLVTQRPGTTARIPIESKHGGFVVHIAGAATYGNRAEVTTTKNNALVFADAEESDDSSSEDFLQVTTSCASSTSLDEVTLCQYLVCAGEKVEETWCKKLVANGAVIAKDEVEARAIAAQIELDKTFVSR